ncbi:MAG: hypothetical protein MEQ74_11935 [Paracoccus sp.]|nr:hypothetical protein [Paracoccus sp. (in: a-proteobacteria)]
MRIDLLALSASDPGFSKHLASRGLWLTPEGSVGGLEQMNDPSKQRTDSMSNQAPTPSLADLEARLEMSMRATLKAAADVVAAGGSVEETASTSKLKDGLLIQGIVMVSMTGFEKER